MLLVMALAACDAGQGGPTPHDVTADADGGTEDARTIHIPPPDWGRACPVEVPEGPSAPEGPIRDIWGTSPDAVWAVAGPAVHRWDGDDWHQLYVTCPSVDLLDIGGTSPDDIWAVGEDGAVVHWNGERWSEDILSGRDFVRVRALAPGEVWAVELRKEGRGLSANEYRTWRYQRGAWRQAASEDVDVVVAGLQTTDGGVTWALGRHGRVDPDGESERTRAVLRWNGESWKPVEPQPSDRAERISAAVRDEAWVVTREGEILHYVEGAWVSRGEMLPAEWLASVAPWLTNVTAVGPGSAWVANWSGSLFAWSGEEWSPVALDPERRFPSS